MNNENKKRYISGYHQEKDITQIDKKEITAVNLFIIREMFKLISDSQVQLKHFYSFLFTQGRTFSLTDRLNICEKFEVSLDDFYLDLQKDENVVKSKYFSTFFGNLFPALFGSQKPALS